MVQAESAGPPGIRKTGTAREFRRFCETSRLSPFCPPQTHFKTNDPPHQNPDTAAIRALTSCEG